MHFESRCLYRDKASMISTRYLVKLGMTKLQAPSHSNLVWPPQSLSCARWMDGRRSECTKAKDGRITLLFRVFGYQGECTCGVRFLVVARACDSSRPGLPQRRGEAVSTVASRAEPTAVRNAPQTILCQPCHESLLGLTFAVSRPSASLSLIRALAPSPTHLNLAPARCRGRPRSHARGHGEPCHCRRDSRDQEIRGLHHDRLGAGCSARAAPAQSEAEAKG